MKLPKNYVPGQGEVKATAFGGIGQRLLEKHGWQKGEGLGKDKSGMKEALDVKKKEDTLGVGARAVSPGRHAKFAARGLAVGANLSLPIPTAGRR